MSAPTNILESILPSNPETTAPPEAKAEHTLALGGETDHGLALDGKRAEIMQETLNLYQLKPSLQFLKEVWIPETGIFEDGVCFAQGFDEYAAQWYGMVKIFSKSETLAWKVTKNEPRLIEFELRQLYTLKGTGTQKQMDSIIRLHLDENERIIHHADHFWGQPLESKSEAGWKGRRLNAVSVPWMVKVPSSEEEAEK